MCRSTPAACVVAAFSPLAFPLAALLLAAPASATTFAPPMLDIATQCGRIFHSASAMSECVVAESEARAELLSHWDKYPDASAETCIKIGKKAKRQPYTAMAKCLAPETVALPPRSGEAAR